MITRGEVETSWIRETVFLAESKSGAVRIVERDPGCMHEVTKKLRSIEADRLTGILRLNCRLT